MTARLLVLCAALAVGLCAAGSPSRPVKGLHNVLRLTPRVLSGRSPNGADGFASLSRLGVRTVLSVDGATPEVELAARHGLRYVHLPVGYDGVPPAQLARITKALRDLPGPVYVHCHHGKHRGPAAAAAALVCLDELTPDQAVAFMKQAGTDARYQGLITLPHTLTKPRRGELDRLPDDYPPAAPTAELTRTMVKVDETWDRLKLGTNFATDAVLLQEYYRESRRLPEVVRRGEAFVALFAEAERAAVELEASAPEVRAAALKRSQKLCTQCHAKWRD